MTNESNQAAATVRPQNNRETVVDGKLVKKPTGEYLIGFRRYEYADKQLRAEVTDKGAQWQGQQLKKGDVFWIPEGKRIPSWCRILKEDEAPKPKAQLKLPDAGNVRTTKVGQSQTPKP